MIYDSEKAILDHYNPMPFELKVNSLYPPGDGICNGVYNIEYFNYDGFDCCGLKISNNSLCNDVLGDCTCHLDGKLRPMSDGSNECDESWIPYTYV